MCGVAVHKIRKQQGYEPLGRSAQQISKALKDAKKGAAVLLYGDETTFHLLPVLRRMWMRVGEQAKILTPSSWNKAFSVFGALNTVSGELFWEIFDRKNSDYFIIFLERLFSAHPDKISISWWTGQVITPVRR